jgi:acyl-CoA synthetase (AMP-forming)/AMP-acid ligase II
MQIGRTSYLMAPATFLSRPIRWLQTISHFRATISGAPNFAYELCAAKATPEQVAELDLSCWRVAFNGAEPVRAETLERFAQTFRPCGFRPAAAYPCYGLAESTLIVTGGEHDHPPQRNKKIGRACEVDLLTHHALETISYPCIPIKP